MATPRLPAVKPNSGTSNTGASSSGLVGRQPQTYGQCWVADVMDIWAVAHPGRRPPLFWSQTSPRPFRERLGGTGAPAAAWTAYVPRWHLGVPCDWLWAGRDLPPDTENHARPDDPPVYESQAAALKRMGMLLPGECRRLTKAAYAPVRLAPP